MLGAGDGCAHSKTLFPMSPPLTFKKEMKLGAIRPPAPALAHSPPGRPPPGRPPPLSPSSLFVPPCSLPPPPPSSARQGYPSPSSAKKRYHGRSYPTLSESIRVYLGPTQRLTPTALLPRLLLPIRVHPSLSESIRFYLRLSIHTTLSESHLSRLGAQEVHVTNNGTHGIAAAGRAVTLRCCAYSRLHCPAKPVSKTRAVA